jgi:hypothetical protein
MYNEHIGRRNIASLTVPRKSARAKKVVKIRPDEAAPSAVPRMSITFDMFDKVGSGVTLEADEQRATAVHGFSQRGHGERLYSVSRLKAKSEADSLVEDIYGSIGTVKARPPPPAAPGVPRAPSIPTVPNPTGAPLARMASFSAQRPNPAPKPAFITPPAPSTPAPAPPPPPPPTPNVHADNFYEDVNVPAASTPFENIYQNPTDSNPNRGATGEPELMWGWMVASLTRTSSLCPHDGSSGGAVQGWFSPAAASASTTSTGSRARYFQPWRAV